MTTPKPGMSDGTRGWLFIIGVIIVVLIIAFANGSDDSSSTSTDTPAPFGNEDCVRQADELLAKFPQTYANRQEAYDGCRAAGTLITELKQEVDKENGVIVTR